MSEKQQDGSRMQALHTRIGEVGKILSRLRDLIRAQRMALEHGESPDELLGHLRIWEATLGRIEHEAVLDKNARLHSLYQVSQALNASLDWEQTAETVIDAVIQVTGAERGTLLIRENGELEPKVSRGPRGRSLGQDENRFSHSIIERALEEEKPILTTNARADPRFQESDSIVALGLRSILCAPLIYHGEALGVIYVENRARSGLFGYDDLALLAAFANQAATAVANARLHRQTDLALAQRVHELTLLQEMARDLNARLNFDRVMERSIAWAVAGVGAEAGSLGLLAESGLRWVSSIGDPEIDEETAEDALYRRTPTFSAQRLILPLLREGRPLGVFYLLAGQHPFTQEKVEFVSRMADSAAIAVENARLYEALRNANMAKSEFVSLVSHELRTPMTSIRGYTDMLAKGMVGDLTPQQLEFVETIRRNVERMRILVSDLLDISRIETGRLKLEPQVVAFETVVEEAHRTVEEMMEEKEQHFVAKVPEALPEVFADPDRLTQILINLLSNASKYTPEGGKIAVRARPDDSGFVRCAVKDTGVGISPEDQRRLFTKFFRSEDPAVREQTGTGLGLVIAKNLVEIQGGRMWVRSKVGVGSTFYFQIPEADGQSSAE